MSYTLKISTKHNPEQHDFAESIHSDDKKVIYCTGNAGTGKTFIALAAAFQAIEDKKFRKIFYLREPVEVGNSLGFLPGDLNDKYNVYLSGLMDNIESISKMTKKPIEYYRNKIECVPPQFIRGRNFTDAVIIADEAQNFSYNTIKTILTRMGENCKVILIGSTNQIDSLR